MSRTFSYAPERKRAEQLSEEEVGGLKWGMETPSAFITAVFEASVGSYRRIVALILHYSRLSVFSANVAETSSFCQRAAAAPSFVTGTCCPAFLLCLSIVCQALACCTFYPICLKLK